MAGEHTREEVERAAERFNSLADNLDGERARILRPARPADAGRLAEIHVAAWRAAYDGVMSEASLSAQGVAARTSWWRDLLGGQTPPRVTVIGEHGGLAGFLILAEPSRDPDAGELTAEIAALNVDPEQWDQGFGGELVRDALERLRREHWRAVTLWVASENARAIRFYRSIGFDFDGASGADDNGIAEQRMKFDLARVES